MLNSAGQGSLSASIRYSVDVYKLIYPMEYQGKTINASGLVAVPISEGEKFPVLSFQHGTMVAKSEAPTVDILGAQAMSVSALAGAGYVVVVPDYIGFGESAQFRHPFFNKESNVNSVTAMLQAVEKLNDGVLSGASINDSLFLAGYSQGGWVTLAVMKSLESNSDGWNLIATACGAGPYNPEQVKDYALSLTEYGHPYYMPYVFLSFQDAGTVTASLSSFFKEPYASKIPSLYDGLHSGTQIDNELTKVTKDLYTDNFLNNYSDASFDEVRNSFELNRVTAWNNQTPLLLLHGEADVYIPKEVSEQIFQEFTSSGSHKVEYVPFPGLDHNTAAVPAIGYSFTWFQGFRNPIQALSTAW